MTKNGELKQRKKDLKKRFGVVMNRNRFISSLKKEICYFINEGFTDYSNSCFEKPVFGKLIFRIQNNSVGQMEFHSVVNKKERGILKNGF